jgi:hypothetical protein
VALRKQGTFWRCVDSASRRRPPQDPLRPLISGHPRDPDAFAVVSGLHPVPTNRNELEQPIVEFGGKTASAVETKGTAGGHLNDVMPMLLLPMLLP